MDSIDLQFEEGALRAIAQETLKKETGARGLRGVLERVLMPVMYRSPSDEDIQKITITEGTVLGTEEPVISHDGDKA